MIELRHPEERSQLGKASNIIGICGGVRTPEFGYWIGSEHWGKGYTIEAMRAVVDTYWDLWPEGIPSLPEDKRNVIELIISPENKASMAVARKLGGVKIGEKVVEDLGPNNTNPDGTKKDFTLGIWGVNRPPASERANAPRSYEKIEVVGPNLTDTPPAGVEGSEKQD